MAFIDLAALKDDLGITGTADDAWLARRIAGVLSAMSNYTHRYIGDVVTFEDDFTRIVDGSRLWIAPPFPALMRVAPRLRHRPVVEIMSATNNGNSIDVADVLFNPETGEIQSIEGAPAVDLARSLIGAVVIQYKAGWAEIPADLYEALVGIIRNMWTLRKAGAAGGLEIGGRAVESIQVPDVGSVQLGSGATAWEGATMKGAIDPILGPWRTVLDPYFVPVIGDVARPSTRLVP